MKSRESKPKTLDIQFYGTIGDIFDGITGAEFTKMLGEYREASTINVYMNSPGGIAHDGIAMYNALSKHRAHVNMYIEGVAASAASIVAMAGDTISIAENAMIMIHDPWNLTIGTADDHAKEARALERLAESAAATYAARTGLDQNKARGLMLAETWMTANEAVELGFATELTAPLKAAACIPKNMFRHTPARFLITDTSVKDLYRKRINEVMG